MQLVTMFFSFKTSTISTVTTKSNYVNFSVFLMLVSDILPCQVKHNLKIQTLLLQDSSASTPDKI